MHGQVRNRRGRVFLLLAPVVALCAVIPAGRSDAVETVTAQEVVDGLKQIEASAIQAADFAATDKAKAEQKAGEIEPAWSKIEDTVRANHKEAYVALEKAIDSVVAGARAGDAKLAGGGASALSSAVKFYAASFPAGFGTSAAPKEGDRAAAAAEKKAAADTGAAAAAAPSGTLARTGPDDGLLGLAGGAFGLGGLAVMAGARRRTRRV